MAGDFDADGAPDLVTADDLDSTVSLLQVEPSRLGSVDVIFEDGKRLLADFVAPLGSSE